MGEVDTDYELGDVLAEYPDLDGATAVTVDMLNLSISDVLDTSENLYFDDAVGDVSDYRVAKGYLTPARRLGANTASELGDRKFGVTNTDSNPRRDPLTLRYRTVSNSESCFETAFC